MTTHRSWTPSDEQMTLWPSVSGNAINGLGERRHRRPSAVYWHAPDATPHGPLQRWFLSRTTPLVRVAREERQRAIDEPLAPLAETREDKTPSEWSREVKRVAKEAGADVVGIARVNPEWVFEGHDVPQARVIVLGFAHDWEAIRTAPEEASAAEVIRQYARGISVAKKVAGFLRSRGHEAHPHGGPMAFPMLLIPAAIAAGLGELGKHGSLIHRELGSSFRLACVLTDVPMDEDAPDDFGGDDFCTRCRACSDACPPQAIVPVKQLVRGEVRWYVDFDKCLPYFNEHQGCAVCLAACPWNRPGVSSTLVRKMAARRAR